MALFRHVISGTSPGEQWSFTYHTEGTLSVGDAEAANAAAITAAYTAGFDDVTTSDVDTTLSSTAGIDPLTDGQTTRAETVLALTGVAVSAMLPFQCATVISLRTAMATRSGRGRFFLPPLAASVLESGRVNAASITILVTAFTAFFDTLDTAGLQVMVRNRTLHQSTVVTEARVGNVIDTQRRRRNKLLEVYSAIPV